MIKNGFIYGLIFGFLQLVYANDPCFDANQLISEGKTWMQQQKHVKAGEKFLEALQFSNDCSEDSIKAKANYTLGLYNAQINFKTKAIEYFNKTLAFDYTQNNKGFQATVINEKGAVLLDTIPEEALQLFNASIDLILTLEDTSNLIYPYNNLTILYLYYLDQKEKAFQYLQRIRSFKSVPLQMHIANLGLTASSYYEINELDSALKYFKECLLLSESSNNVAYQTNCWYHIAQIQEVKGEFDKAYPSFRKYNALKDSIYRIDQQKQFLEVQNDHEKQIQKVENELLEQKNKVVIVGSLAGGIILLILFLNYRNKQKIRSEKIQSELALKTRNLMSNEMFIAKKEQLIESLSTELEKLKANSEDEMATEIQQLTSKIKLESNTKEDWDSFLSHFESVHPSFFEKINKAHDGLTPSDLKFCAYIKMNLTTKDLTRMLNVSDRTVQSKRYRLKKKLELPSEMDLTEYINSLN